MKKAFVWVMMGILTVSMLAGCGKKTVEPESSEPVSESVAEPEVEPEPEEPTTPEGMARSYLTGEWITNLLYVLKFQAIITLAEQGCAYTHNVGTFFYRNCVIIAHTHRQNIRLRILLL